MSSSDGPLSDIPEQRFREAGGATRHGGDVDSPTLPLPPPQNRDELERLILAVALTPSSDRQLIVDTVAAFQGREQVADLLNTALLEVPVHDVGRQGIVMSLIGELRHGSSVEPLERFVWLDEAQVNPPDTHQDSSGSACVFEPLGALQARAAEMLVWVTKGSYMQGIQLILNEHPSTQVRVATIDACAFAAGDDPATLDTLRGIVQVGDRWAVGLPRRAANRNGEFDVAEFDAAVTRQLSEFGTDPDLPDVDDGSATSGSEHSDVR
ncbi:MAG: hypothetical protein JWN03_5103 [Nocardia sp.]|uniref:hypothetical protein n=1 Tax=Nocardia sp. TaxID=1821 RepID=UPI0026099563|nr:hypothetical protein [Nocardia sp.]MCU1644828.1 hypothetical protein [Nocardia sp.]